MGKLQKRCPNYTQVCTIAKSGGWPQVSPPRGAQFLCRHQTSLGEYPALTPRYWFAYLPAYYRGGVAKSYEAGKRLFARRPKPGLRLPKTLKKPQETGGTETHWLQVLHSPQWHQPSKGERALWSSPHPALPHLHSHATWGCPGRGLRHWWPTCESIRERIATKQLWPNRNVTTRFPVRAPKEGVPYQRAQRR